MPIKDWEKRKEYSRNLMKKRRCREYGDVVKKTIDRFISNSKLSDKKYNRLDIVNFIDRDFLKLLIEECDDKCCYCKNNI